MILVEVGKVPGMSPGSFMDIDLVLSILNSNFESPSNAVKGFSKKIPFLTNP